MSWRSRYAKKASWSKPGAVHHGRVVAPRGNVQRVVVVGALPGPGAAEQRVAAVDVERVGEAVPGPAAGEEVRAHPEPAAERALVAQVQLDRVGGLVGRGARGRAVAVDVGDTAPVRDAARGQPFGDRLDVLPRVARLEVETRVVALAERRGEDLRGAFAVVAERHEVEDPEIVEVRVDRAAVGRDARGPGRGQPRLREVGPEENRRRSGSRGPAP